IQNDRIYPYEHFMCKSRIFKNTLEKATCPCKLEKGILCTSLPQFHNFTVFI
ncbi:hypothetical protein TNCT_18421, partial [Trichonephila clavata]